MIAMCDSRDISGVVDSKNLGRSTMIVYDRYPGGLGYSEKGYQRLASLLELCWEMVADCPCEDGCPSCIQSPKCGNNNKPLDKMAAGVILREMVKG